MSGTDIAKAGWLFRQTSVLHRWKKNWFVLYQDGVLRYFESPDSSRAEDVFVLHSACSQIKTGSEVSSVTPPDEVSNGKMCLLQLNWRDGTNMVLCAENPDDLKAWYIALEQARVMGETRYVRRVPMYYEYGSYYPYGGYPGQIINSSPNTQVIQRADGTTAIIPPNTQVVFVDDYAYSPYRSYGTGSAAATGFLTGALLGSALMWPLWWW